MANIDDSGSNSLCDINNFCDVCALKVWGKSAFFHSDWHDHDILRGRPLAMPETAASAPAITMDFILAMNRMFWNARVTVLCKDGFWGVCVVYRSALVQNDNERLTASS